MVEFILSCVLTIAAMIVATLDDEEERKALDGEDEYQEYETY